MKWVNRDSQRNIPESSKLVNSNKRLFLNGLTDLSELMVPRYQDNS